MNELIFVTSSEGKAREAQHVLGDRVKRVKLDLDEIQSPVLREVVEYKVRQAYAKLKKQVIVEDVSLEVKQWNGFPGTFIKWFEQAIPMRDAVYMLRKKDRGARWIVAYGFYDGKTFFYGEGVTKGTIAKRATEDSSFGFGFDSVFIPRGYAKTNSELGFDMKVKIGSRTKALKKLKRFLNSHL